MFSRPVDKAGAVIEPAPIFDYNLGQCYRQLGKYEDAIWHYQQFLKTSPNTPEHSKAVQDFVAQMKAELEKKAMNAPPTEAAQTSVEATTAPAASPAPKGQPELVPSEHDPWYADGVGWGLTGVGVAGLAVSGALFMNASNLRDDANVTPGQQEQNALHDKADSRALLGTVIGIGGVGILATGIVKLAIHSERSDRASTAWGIAVSSTTLGVWGRF